MIPFLLFLRDFFWLLYAGPMIAFTLLIVLTPISAQPQLRARIRAFQSWGPGFGIALGLCIYSAVAGFWMQNGDFDLPWQTSSEQLFSSGVLVGLCMWISNIKLEIWTLDPIRKKDDVDLSSYVESVPPLKKHLVVHSLMVAITSALCQISGL